MRSRDLRERLREHDRPTVRWIRSIRPTVVVDCSRTNAAIAAIARAIVFAQSFAQVAQVARTYSWHSRDYSRRIGRPSSTTRANQATELGERLVAIARASRASRPTLAGD